MACSLSDGMFNGDTISPFDRTGPTTRGDRNKA